MQDYSHHHTSIEREEETKPTLAYALFGMGITIMLAGLGMVLWVFGQIQRILAHPTEATKLQELIETNVEAAVEMAAESYKVLIPHDFLSFLLVAILLGIAGNLTIKVIGAGRQCMELGFRHVQKHLQELRAERAQKKREPQEPEGPDAGAMFPPR